MEIEKIENEFGNEFTILSKTGCFFCESIKSILDNKNMEFKEINCDIFLNDSKKEFLNHIFKLANKEVNTFPMIFYGKNYVGGYNDTKIYLEKMFLSVDDDYNF